MTYNDNFPTVISKQSKFFYNKSDERRPSCGLVIDHLCECTMLFNKPKKEDTSVKIIITIVTAIMICALMVFSVQAAEKQIKPGTAVINQTTTPVTIFTGCPPGFTATGNQNDPATFRCVKNQPANPCAPGYTVKWGPCPASEQPCSYSCSASAPSAAAKTNFDKGICAKVHGKQAVATPCAIWCGDIIY